MRSRKCVDTAHRAAKRCEWRVEKSRRSLHLNHAIILYHFTTLPALFAGEPMTARLLNLCEQWPDGIMPTSNAFPYMRPAVCLTNDPEPGCATGKPGNCVRISVKIQTTDRRLVPYRTALPKLIDKANRKNGKQVTLQQFADDLPRDFLQKAFAAWWLYYDRVPLGKIIDCEIIAGRQPWWLVETA